MADEGENAASGKPSERERWTAELRFKERELTLKEREQASKEAELALRRTEAATAGWKSPLVVALIAGTVAASGNAVVATVNGVQQRELEDLKSEQSRILEMIKTGDADKAAENLGFLLKSGLITRPTLIGKVEAFLKTRTEGQGPALPAPTPTTFHGTSLEERRKLLPPPVLAEGRPAAARSFRVAHHLLLDGAGTPVSLVETSNRGKPLASRRVIVIHGTASLSARSAAHFLSGAVGSSKASAHLLIDRDGSVTQIVAFDVTAWHAGTSTWKDLTGLDSSSLGIELVNAQRVARQGDGWVARLTNTPLSAEEVLEVREPTTGEITGWHRFSELQLQALEAVIRALHSAYPELEAVVRHSEVSAHKTDPGPAFPLARFQALLTERGAAPAPSSR